jgi:DNA (cytosine-5)-methyltransferase 1
MLNAVADVVLAYRPGKKKIKPRGQLRRAFTAIDLFSGAGGLSTGFAQAGFKLLAANDFDSDASATFRLNHPETPFIDGAIQDITTRKLLDIAGVRKGELDVLVGGPPCQAFSVYNHQRGMHDERSGLFREYLRIVEGVMPRIVVMENVTGITSVGEGRAVKEIYSNLERLGFHVEHRILKAEEFGVPQERRRLFFIASRELEKIRWPNPTHESHDLPLLIGKRLLPLVTVDDAISDLPPLGICEGDEESEYTIPPRSDFQAAMRKRAGKLYNHVAPFLADINLKRLKHIPQGGSWRDIPHDLLPSGMKLAKRSDHTKRYGRLHPDGLCCTILTKCDLHWGSFIHPHQERTLTVREAARLQTFPDHVRFTGSRMNQFRQVGNAVPPALAKAVAMAIAKMLRIGGAEGLNGAD